ncbi:hypothetical protein CTI14_08445, partial [Methylobacterium radiotolerans]
GAAKIPLLHRGLQPSRRDGVRSRLAVDGGRVASWIEQTVWWQVFPLGFGPGPPTEADARRP